MTSKVTVQITLGQISIGSASLKLWHAASAIVLSFIRAPPEFIIHVVQVVFFFCWGVFFWGGGHEPFFKDQRTRFTTSNIL